MKLNELTMKIKSGDRAAFDALCRDRYASLYSYARLFVETTTAEDVIQDVLFSVWQKRRDLDEESDLQGYLIRSVYNRCMNIISRTNCMKQYRNWYRERICTLLSNYLAPEYNPVMSKVYNAELGRNIEKAIASLPPRCCEVFRLSYIDNLSEKEISEKLGISISTVENHIYLALKNLRSILRAEYEGR